MAKSPVSENTKKNKQETVLKIATVMRAIPGTYGLMIRENGAGVQEVPCLYVPGMMSFLFGVKDCSLPTEGSKLLVLSLPGAPDKYIGLCSLPEELSGINKIEDTISFISMFGSSPEPGADYWSVKSYVEEGGDTDKPGNLMCNSSRPWNVLPGEWAIGNTMGAFIALFHFMATLKATERAKLECFIFDDLVRITSGQFQHWNAFGETHIFDDGGIANIEIGGSHYVPETRGYENFDTMTEVTTQSAVSERYQAANNLAIMKKRFRLFMGGLGDMIQIYLRNMRDGASPDTADTEERWGASFKMHLDNSGALNMASIAGIGLFLNDKIPVPKRIKEAWDPKGDKLEDINNDDDIFKKKEHYDYGDDDQYMRNLKAVDAEAFEEKLSYQRFDELSKDFKVNEAKDLEQVPDEYDHLKSDSKLSKYKNRKAGFKLESDGSIRIWDAWGSEIYTRGGDIIVSCPGHIIMQPGKGIVGMSNNVIFKAKRSMDFTSEDKDIRIACGGNIMSRAGKGMLFQADGEGSPIYNDSDKGEDTQGGGIIFVAKKSEIHIWGKTITFLADVFRTKVKDAIKIVADKLVAYTKSVLMLECAGKSGVACTSSGATVFGPGAILAGGNSAHVTRGNKVGVFIDWSDTQTNIYSQSSQATQHEANYTSDSDLSILASDKRDKIKFTYRTAEQYGTKTGIEVYEPNTQFKLYQTRWQLLAKIGGGLLSDISTEKWKEKEIEGTYPWPGADSRNKCYVGLSSVSNVKDATLEPVERKSMVGKFQSNVEVGSMDDYIIVN